MPRAIPFIVQTLAKKARTEKVPNPIPFDWWEYPDRVVIVFEDGRKLTFEREQATQRKPAQGFEYIEEAVREEAGSAAPGTALSASGGDAPKPPKAKAKAKPKVETKADS